jgi:hypothetical protein
MRGCKVDNNRFCENYSTANSSNTDPQTLIKSHLAPTVTPPAKGTVTPPATPAKGKPKNKKTPTKKTPTKKPQRGKKKTRTIRGMGRTNSKQLRR